MRKSKNFTTFVNAMSMESCFSMPHSISASIIINYTNMVGHYPCKARLIKSKLIFADFGHYREEKTSVVLASFKKGRGWEVSPIFFENRQKVP